MRLLSIPLKLDVLLLDQDTPVVGPLVHFEWMPYVEDGHAINPDVPFLSSEVQTEPFSPSRSLLGKGCHLHWALPAALTRTTPLTSSQRASAPATPDDEPRFPPTPDRWLVRRSRNNRTDALWLVESDYFAPAPSEGILYPIRTDSEHGVKTVYLGRTTRLDLLAPRPPTLPSGDQAGYLGYLTAIGHGDPAFHAFYPNCRSIFGFWDPEVTDADRGSLRYEIAGWYHADVLDPFGGNVKDRWDPAIPDVQRVISEITRQFGWDLTCLSAVTQRSDLPERIICLARIDIVGESALTLRDQPEIQPATAIANTGTEALSALLSRTVYGADRAKAGLLEEQLDALHLASLLGTDQLDLGPRFKEARHTRGFSARTGPTIWRIRPSLPDVRGDKANAAVPDAALPDGLAVRLDELNSLQQALDAVTARREASATQLHSDWVKYMEAAYPVAGVAVTYPNIDDIVRYIDETSLPEIDQLVQTQKSLAGQIELKKADIVALIALSSPELALEQRPGPRFWQPNEPVVLLSGYADATDRHDSSDMLPCACVDVSGSADLNTWIWAGPSAAMETLFSQAPLTSRSNGYSVSDGRTEHPCLLEWEVEMRPVVQRDAPDPAGRTIAADYLNANFSFDPGSGDWIATQPTQNSTSRYAGRSVLTPHASEKLRRELEAFFAERVPAGKRAAFRAWASGAPADPFRLAWLAQNWTGFAHWYLTLGSHLAVSMGGSWVEACLARLQDIISLYDENQALRLDQVRLIATEGLLRDAFETMDIDEVDPASPLPGALGPAFVRWYRRELHLIEFLAIYRDHVHDMDHVLSQALSGFNDALLMHWQGYNLPIADPMGLPDYQAFTKRVADAVGTSHRSIPQPLGRLMPLHAGQLDLLRLRLIDTFGRARMLPDGDVVYPSSWRADDDLCHLPPRLVQPAKLSLRWLSASHADHRETTDDPTTSPLCGWLIANDLDESIAVYTADGKVLGAIDDSARRWTPVPGGGLAASDAIENPYLRAVVGQIQAAVDRGSLRDVLDNMNEATAAIDPDTFEQHQAIALLMSRPLALVRVAVAVRTMGPLAIDQSWDDLARDMSAGASLEERSNAGMDRLQVRVQIGDRGRLNDGVVGLWPEGADDDSGAVVLEPYQHQHVSTEARPGITVTLNSQQPAQFVALMDPRAALYAFTGILPAKSITIPPIHFSDALQCVEVFFQASPVIAGLELIDLPLMTLDGKAWTWLEKEGETWSEQEIVPPATQPAFQQTQMIREGWLKLRNTPD
ncbi:MAG: hypothetical protein SH809_05185 [Rhodothermales bacterium]|nr:hypothetical protein [Rhodothermales bacterium]